MSFATIEDLRESLAQPHRKARTPEYVRRMLHDVPDADVVDRAEFVTARCRDRAVLHVGASGELHRSILKCARQVCGLDREADPSAGVIAFDLDDVAAELPRIDGAELVVCGEVLEHLGNPLHLLNRLRDAYPGVPVIVTVPNAFSEIARRHMQDGTENVNAEHCAWYSYRTLRTLVERAGYAVKEFHWYGAGKPGFNEGLIFVLG